MKNNFIPIQLIIISFLINKSPGLEFPTLNEKILINQTLFKDNFETTRFKKNLPEDFIKNLEEIFLRNPSNATINPNSTDTNETEPTTDTPDENDVPPIDEKPQTEPKYSLIDFLTGSLATAGVLGIFITTLCICFMPTGWFCDNFLKKPGQPPFKVRKREIKRVYKSEKERRRFLARRKKAKKKIKKKELKEEAKIEKASSKEEKKAYKQQWAEKKKKDREKTIAFKQKEKLRKEKFKDHMKESKEAEKKLQQKLWEKQDIESDAFGRVKHDIKMEQRMLKGSHQTFHVQATPTLSTAASSNSEEDTDDKELKEVRIV